VHAAAVVAEKGLGHERGALAAAPCDVLDDVLVEQQVVRRAHKRIVLQVDLGLAAGGDFVVVAFHVQPALQHHLHHLGAQVLH